MDWFKKKSLWNKISEVFDIGKPKYNINIIFSKLEPYESIDSMFAIKNDFFLSIYLLISQYIIIK